MSNSSRQAAKTLLKTIESLPKERLPYSISFKESQYERFRLLTGAPKKYVIKNKKPSVKEIFFRKPKQDEGLANSEKFKEKITAKDLEKMTESLENLTNNKFLNYYELTDKMLKPAGYPNYYERLLKEIKGENKETWASAIRTVIYGK